MKKCNYKSPHKQIFLLFFYVFLISVKILAQEPYQNDVSVGDLYSVYDSKNDQFMLINKYTGERVLTLPPKWQINHKLERETSDNLIRFSMYYSGKEHFGYVDLGGNWLVDSKYLILSHFYRGAAIVQIDYDKCRFGSVDKRGEMVLPIQYDFIPVFNSTTFYTPFIPAKKNNLYGLVDFTTGKELTEFKYHYIQSPVSKYGICQASTAEGSLVLLNVNGKHIFEQKKPKSLYLKTAVFKNKILISLDQNDKKFQFIDTAGNVLTQEGRDFENCKTLLKAEYTIADFYEIPGDTIYLIKDAGGFGKSITDAQLNPILPMQKFSYGFKILPMHGIDQSLFQINCFVENPNSTDFALGLFKGRQLILRPEYSNIKYPVLENGLEFVFAEKEGRWCAVNMNGKNILNANYDFLDAIHFDGKSLIVAYNDTFPMLFDAQGQAITDPKLVQAIHNTYLPRVASQTWFIKRKENAIQRQQFNVVTNGAETIVKKAGDELFKCNYCTVHWLSTNKIMYIDTLIKSPMQACLYDVNDRKCEAQGRYLKLNRNHFALQNNSSDGTPLYAIYHINGSRLTNFEFDKVVFGNEDRFFASTKGELMRMYDAKLQPVTAAKYVEVYSFVNKLAGVKIPENNTYAFIDKQGNIFESVRFGKPEKIIEHNGLRYLLDVRSRDTLLRCNTVGVPALKFHQPLNNSSTMGSSSGNSSTSKKNCPYCQGQGKVKGMIGDPCRVCNGSGGDPRHCYSCDGKGYVAETKVLHAYYYGSVNRAQAITQTTNNVCRSCKGRGKIGFCYYCDGRGAVNLQKGEVDCNHCKGTGELYKLSR